MDNINDFFNNVMNRCIEEQKYKSVYKICKESFIKNKNYHLANNNITDIIVNYTYNSEFLRCIVIELYEGGPKYDHGKVASDDIPLLTHRFSNMTILLEYIKKLFMFDIKIIINIPCHQEVYEAKYETINSFWNELEAISNIEGQKNAFEVILADFSLIWIHPKFKQLLSDEKESGIFDVYIKKNAEALTTPLKQVDIIIKTLSKKNGNVTLNIDRMRGTRTLKKINDLENVSVLMETKDKKPVYMQIKINNKIYIHLLACHFCELNNFNGDEESCKDILTQTGMTEDMIKNINPVELQRHVTIALQRLPSCGNSPILSSEIEPLQVPKYLDLPYFNINDTMFSNTMSDDTMSDDTMSDDDI